MLGALSGFWLKQRVSLGRCLVARTVMLTAPVVVVVVGEGRMALEEGACRFVLVPALDTSNKNSSALSSCPILTPAWPSSQHCAFLTVPGAELF